MDVEFLCHDAHQYHDRGRHQFRRARGKVELRAEVIDESARHAGQRINIAAQQERHLIQEHIPDKPADRTRDGPHHDGHPERQARLQTFADAHHREQPQPDGVEHKQGAP